MDRMAPSTTHAVEEKLEELSIDDWVSKSRKIKWNFAHKLACTSEGRWSKQVLDWNPRGTQGRRQRAGRPSVRWEDSLNMCVVKAFEEEHKSVEESVWKQVALDIETWSALEPSFLR